MNLYARIRGRINGDHHDVKTSAFVLRRRRNQPRRLTSEQTRNILRRHT